MTALVRVTVTVEQFDPDSEGYDDAVTLTVPLPIMSASTAPVQVGVVAGDLGRQIGETLASQIVSARG